MTEQRDDHMRTCILFLKLIGLLRFTHRNPILNAALFIYSYFNRIYFFSFVFSQNLQLLLTFSEASFELFDNASITMTYTAAVGKVFVATRRSTRNLLEQIRTTDRLIKQSNDKAYQTMYGQSSKRCNNLALFFIVFGYLTLLFFYLIPFMGRNPDGSRILVFSNWMPFNTRKHFITTYAYHLYAGSMGCGFTVITDTFLWGLMLFPIGQIKLLQYSLREMSQCVSLQKKLNPSLSEHESYKLCLKRCVRLHRIIISYVEKLDQSLKWFVFCDFVLKSAHIGICVMRFLLAESFGLPECVSLEYLLCVLTQMFFFYWIANELILESKRIQDSIWESDWYNFPDDIKKDLKFMIMRCSKPMKLNIGPFYPMSTESGGSVVKAAYSMTALFYQVYGK